MAGDDIEIITLDSSEDEEESPKEIETPPGMLLFSKFVASCAPLIADIKKRAKMITLLEKRFNQAKLSFQESEEFANILSAHIAELSTKKKDAFKHILDIVNVLKSAASENSKSSKFKHVKDDGDRGSDHEQKKQDRKCGGSDAESSSKEKPKSDGFYNVTSGSERESSVAESDSYTQLKEDQKKEASDKPSPEIIQDSDEHPHLSLPDTTPDKVASADVVESLPKAVINPEVVAVVETLVLSEEETHKQQDNAEALQHNSGPEQASAVETVRVSKRVKKKKKVTNRQIRKYERLLHKLSQEIKRLSEKEMTLDEMGEEDSTHILEYQLRKRIMKVYEKLCDLKEVQANTGRVGDRRIKFQGTRYPEINKKLEKLANLQDYFPDFHDVLTLITKVNDRKGLGLERKRLHCIAKDAFETIGKKLQQRRQEDFLANFSSHPTLDFVEARDPAEVDLALQMKLKNNHSLGSEKLNEVTRTYEEKQRTNEAMGVDMEAVSDSDHTEEDSDHEAPKKKRRRLTLLKISDDDDIEVNENFRENDDAEIYHTATTTEEDTATEDDDTADEANAEADDEDDGSDTGNKVVEHDVVQDVHTLSDDDDDDPEEEEDDADDGAEDFGALSPLSLSEEEEDNSDGGNSIQEVHSPVANDKPNKSASCDASDPVPLDTTSNNVPSAEVNSADSASDTNLSSTNSLNNSNRPSTPLSNGVKHRSPQDSSKVGKQNQHQTLTSNGDQDHHRKKGCNEKTKGEDASLAECPQPPSSSTAPTQCAAVQVLDSSSISMPIIHNVKNLSRHGEADKETSTASSSAPGRVPPIPCPGPRLAAVVEACKETDVQLKRGVAKKHTLPRVKSSGKNVSTLPLKDSKGITDATTPSTLHRQSTAPQVPKSSRTTSPSRPQRATPSQEAITLLSSSCDDNDDDDDDDDILDSSNENSKVSSVATIPHRSPHMSLATVKQRTEGTVKKGLFGPSTSNVQEPSGKPATTQRHIGSLSSRQEQKWQQNVNQTSTPARGFLLHTVCSQHKHFGPASKPRNNGETQLITLSDSD